MPSKNSPNPHSDQPKFRAWLVKQLTVSRWSAPVGLSLPELAVELGVQLSVLKEACLLRDAELKRRGKGGLARGRRRYVGRDYSVIEVLMPPAVFSDWVLLCQALRVTPSTVLRSLVQHFLLDPKRPTVTGRTWVYRGKTEIIHHVDRRRAKTRLTRGAQVALDYHADRWSVPPSGVVRGVLTEFLEGRIRRFKVVSFGELWGDPDRYLHPEKFPDMKGAP